MSDVCVNEGSPHAIWTVEGTAGNKVSLSLNSQSGTEGVDTGGLEFYSNGWQPYTPNTLIPLQASGQLLVRTAIVNDLTFEDVETLTLTVKQDAVVAIAGVSNIGEVQGAASIPTSGPNNLMINGDFTTLQGGAAVDPGSRWAPNSRISPINLAGWIESGGGTETYANIYAGGAYFGNFAGWRVTYNGAPLDNSQDYLNLFTGGDFITGSFGFAHVNKTVSEVGDNANPVALTQTVSTRAGTTYRLQFDQRGEFEEPLPEYLPGMAAVEIGGQRIYFKVPFKNTWSTHTLEFIATGATTNIKFMSWGHLLFLNNPSDTTDNRGTDELILDNVIVQEAAFSGSAPSTATLTIKDNGQGCSWFTSANTNGIADPNGPLNDDRGAAPRVNSLTVNEGSPYAVFTVQGLPGANVDLAIVEGTEAAGSTGPDVSGLQWFNAATSQWLDYSSVSPAVVNTDGTVLVRTTPVNDTVFETSETFNLTATYSATQTVAGLTIGASATGLGTITDNGTGQWFTGASGTGSDSAPVGIRLNDDRTVSVNNIAVNEASPYAVFTVTGTAGQYVSLALAPSGSGTGHALLDTDTQDAGSAMPLQVFNGTAWVDYTPGSLVPMPASTLLVRTRVVNDTPYEGAETFTLVATNAGGLSATGTCTIKDDGSGNLYSANNTSGTAEAAGTNGLASALNDDRPITVSDLTVNEATGNAVFTVTGTAGQVVNSLVLAAGTATSGTDYGTSLSYSVDGGTNWLSYTHGSTNITLPAGGSFLVRNSISNDSAYEGAETYTLTATPRGGNAATGTATIVDDGTGSGGTNDDRAANPSVNDLTVNEGSPYAVFIVQGLPGAGMTLSLTNVTSSPANVGTDTGAAAALEYYSATANGGAGGWLTYSSSVTLPASGTLLVRTTITNDAPLEVSETFRLTATYNGTGGGTNGGSDTDTGIGTITDDGTGNLYSASNTTGSADALGSQADLPAALDDDRPSFSVGDVTYNEAAGTITFTVTKTGSTAQSTTVAYATSDGTAVAGQDYTATSGTLTFAAGDTTKTVTVPITNDAVFELSETLNLNLSNPTNARIGDGLGVGTITDDGSGTGGTNDDRPSFAVNDVLVNEAAGTLTFTVSKTGSTTQIATVAYAIADGSGATGAASGSDYSAGTDPLTGTLSFAAGETSKTVTIAITSDSTFENLEELLINLSSASNATISDAQGVGRILDLPAVSIGNATVIEATDPYAVVTVSLSQASALPMTFTPTLANAGTGAGFAVVGTDTQSTPSGAAIEYSLNGTTWLSAATGVTVPAGTTSVQLRSAIKMNDGIGEPIETYTIQTNALSFASGSNSVTASSVSGTVTIIDNPTMSISSVVVNEASPYAMVHVSLSLPASSAISFTPSLSSGTGTAAVDTGTTIEYLNASNQWQTASTFDGTQWTGGITLPQGATGVLLRTSITNDGLSEISEVVNISTGAATHVLNASGVSGTITIVDQGSTVASNIKMFSASATSTTPDLTPASGAVVNPAALLASQMPLDDDRPLSVDNVTVNENSPWIVFKVTGAVDQYVKLATVDGTAVAGTSSPTDGNVDYRPNLQYFDGSAWVSYTANTFVKLPAGGTTLLVRTAIVQDVPYEGAQTFNLVATNTGGTSTPNTQGVGTIVDDGTGTVFVADNPSTPADESVPVNNAAPTLTPPTSAVVDPDTSPVPLPNDDRPLSVNNVTVNEASPFMLFTVTGGVDQYVRLSTADGTAVGGSTSPTDGSVDYRPNLQYFDGSVWVDYTPRSFAKIPGGGMTLLVRTAVVQDVSYEGAQTFNLVATNTGGTSTPLSQGLGTIRDDGQGDLFVAGNQNGTPDALGTPGAPAMLNDDRIAPPAPKAVGLGTDPSATADTETGPTLHSLEVQPSLHVQAAVADSRQLANRLDSLTSAGTLLAAAGHASEGQNELRRTQVLIDKFERVTDPDLHVQQAVASSRQQSHESQIPAHVLQTGLLRVISVLNESSSLGQRQGLLVADSASTLADQTLTALTQPQNESNPAPTVVLNEATLAEPLIASKQALHLAAAGEAQRAEAPLPSRGHFGFSKQLQMSARQGRV